MGFDVVGIDPNQPPDTQAGTLNVVFGQEVPRNEREYIHMLRGELLGEQQKVAGFFALIW